MSLAPAPATACSFNTGARGAPFPQDLPNEQ